ncbi:MAG: hypothetical protein IJN16_06385 [Lachnospiraceae bacterium]|nr:hypothetical protein [Lachnospiraceae bacterium]
MKRNILTFITLLSLCCLTACNAESKNTVGTGNNNEVAADSVVNVPIAEATAAPTEESVAETTPEPTSTPTEVPIAEATPEPTEEPSGVYEGINMESDLSGEEWVKTFVGIIEEPKIVVFSDETGRKEIFENDSILKFNPDTDMLGVYLPDGYARLNKNIGLKDIVCIHDSEYLFYCELKPKETRESGKKMAALYVEYEGEEISLPFVFKPE